MQRKDVCHVICRNKSTDSSLPDQNDKVKTAEKAEIMLQKSVVNEGKQPFDYLYDAEKVCETDVEPNDILVIPFQQHFEKVLVNGEVTNVHEENAWPLRRISEIISDNLTAYSSTRNVQVTSVDGLVTTYDLFLFSRDGDLTQNPYVRAGEARLHESRRAAGNLVRAK